MESFKFLHIKLYYNQALIILNIALKKTHFMLKFQDTKRLI